MQFVPKTLSLYVSGKIARITSYVNISRFSSAFQILEASEIRLIVLLVMLQAARSSIRTLHFNVHQLALGILRNDVKINRVVVDICHKGFCDNAYNFQIRLIQNNAQDLLNAFNIAIKESRDIESVKKAKTVNKSADFGSSGQSARSYRATFTEYRATCGNANEYLSRVLTNF